MEPRGAQGQFCRAQLIGGSAGEAVVVTEAATKSGTRHTMDFADQHSIPALAVPGPITSPMSYMTNQYIKENKASVCTGAEDVLNALGLTFTAAHAQRLHSPRPHGQMMLNLLSSGLSDGPELLVRSGLDVSRF